MPSRTWAPWNSPTDLDLASQISAPSTKNKDQLYTARRPNSAFLLANDQNRSTEHDGPLTVRQGNQKNIGDSEHQQTKSVADVQIGNRSLVILCQFDVDDRGPVGHGPQQGTVGTATALETVD